MDEQRAPAWRRFHEDLVRVITGWDRSKYFRISLNRTSTELTGEVPFIDMDFVGGLEGVVVVEVASNKVLAPQWRLTRQGQSTLRRWDLECPTREYPTYGQSYRRAIPDEPAWVVVSALRDVFGVPDPALLISPDVRLTPPAPELWSVNSAFAECARPKNGTEVDELVDIALGQMMVEVDWDADGDVVVDYLDTIVYIRSSERSPLLRIFCSLGHGVEDPVEAAQVVSRLNGVVHGVKFILLSNHQRVMLMIDVVASPFVPEQLQGYVKHLFQIITDWDEEILPYARDRSASS